MKTVSFFIIIASGLILSCSSNQCDEAAVPTQTAHPSTSQINEPSAGQVQSTNELPQNHESVTTEDKVYNNDGSLTTTKITTVDGIETSRDVTTGFPNADINQENEKSKYHNIGNFSEAYNYARKAYLNPKDIDNSTYYLKKAMGFFESAETDADDVSCDDANFSATEGYQYAKKGYNETDPNEIERYAKKAMNEAESGISYMNSCKK